MPIDAPSWNIDTSELIASNKQIDVLLIDYRELQNIKQNYVSCEALNSQGACGLKLRIPMMIFNILKQLLCHFANFEFDFMKMMNCCCPLNKPSDSEVMK